MVDEKLQIFHHSCFFVHASTVCRGHTATLKRNSSMLVNYVRTAIALKLNQFNVDKRAVTAIEYALIAALIAVVIIGAVTTLGKSVSNTFNSVSSEL